MNTQWEFTPTKNPPIIIHRVILGYIPAIQAWHSLHYYHNRQHCLYIHMQTYTTCLHVYKRHINSGMYNYK